MAISQYIPYGGLEWLTQKKIDRFDANLIPKNRWVGYILEVDLKYPGELHYLHNDYPLAPEKLEITDDMLSKYFMILLKNMEQKFVVSKN